MNINDITTRVSSLNDEIKEQRTLITNAEEHLNALKVKLDEGEYETFSEYQSDYDSFMETLESYDNAVNRHNELIDELQPYINFYEGVG